MFVALRRKSTLCYMLLIIWEWTSERGRVCGPVSGNCLSVQYVPVGSCWVACIHTQCFFPYGPPVCLSYIKAAKIKTAWPQYQQLQHRVYKLTIFLCLKKKKKTLKKCKVKWNSSTFCLPFSACQTPRVPAPVEQRGLCHLSPALWAFSILCQCVRACERHMGMSTVKQMDRVYITWDLGRMPSGW